MLPWGSFFLLVAGQVASCFMCFMCGIVGYLLIFATSVGLAPFKRSEVFFAKKESTTSTKIGDAGSSLR